VVLKDNCYDAGFILPPAMKKGTRVLLGGDLVPGQVNVGRVFGPGEAKVITLRKGKVVNEGVVEGFQKPQHAGQLKEKFSGLLHKLSRLHSGKPEVEKSNNSAHGDDEVMG
jgi:hypothetical protein